MPTEAADRDALGEGLRDRTKKIRLTAAEEDLLAELARSYETNESDVLRRGMRALDRMRRRQENIDRLVELAEDEDPGIVGFELED